MYIIKRICNEDKLTYYLLLLFCLSCAAIKKTENDPFIGKYKMTVFNVDGVGDVPAVLIIDKEKRFTILKLIIKFLRRKEY